MAFNDTRPIIQGTVYDKDGNDITSIPDSSARRLQVEAQLSPGTSVLIGAGFPIDISKLTYDYLRNAGSEDMIVDGSTTPKVFSYSAHPTQDIKLDELRMIISTQDFTMDGNSMGSQPGLTNGILIELIVDGTTVQLNNIKVNEEFLYFPSPIGLLLNNTGPKDILSAGVHFGKAIILAAGSSDEVRITIRDDLTGSGSNEFHYFTARILGEKE